MTTCENCKFFLPITERIEYAPSGVCRRFPPSIFTALGKDKDKTPYIASKFPVVRIDSWCGEHKEL